MLENNNRRLEDIISAKEEKIITLYDLIITFVPYEREMEKGISSRRSPQPKICERKNHKTNTILLNNI
jgi:hypothetical protein